MGLPPTWARLSRSSCLVRTVLIFFLSGCTVTKPLLSHNDHLERVGTARAESDIVDCQQMAIEAGYDPKITKLHLAGILIATIGAGAWPVAMNHGAFPSDHSSDRFSDGELFAIGAAVGFVISLAVVGIISYSKKRDNEKYTRECLEQRGYKTEHPPAQQPWQGY